MNDEEISARLQRLERRSRFLGFALAISAIVSVAALIVGFYALLPWLGIRAALRGLASNDTAVGKPQIEASPVAESESRVATITSLVAVVSPTPNPLLSSLRITVQGKRTFPKDMEAERFSDNVQLTLTAENLSDQRIRAFEGGIEVEDLLGNSIMDLKLVSQDPIGPHQVRELTKYWEINQFENNEVRFETETFENLRFEWDPMKIVFADGRILEAQ